ncbi:alpha-D-ribose 1-methylphosphonate 5-triphosphate diphosphatase [Geminicoccaceae bacterium 1502E]|nr:alpha-D-ribose 1-methylphosphonate 5-triphosphate diphosphatase [Geminicoccaceae bacterium 1502E]
MRSLFSRRVLLPDGTIRAASLHLDEGVIAAVTEDSAPAETADLGELLLAPGLVDIHGDAFERQIMPRPGVMIDLRVGLEETDRQLAANGVTTAFHGLTWSWEPGLRSTATGRKVMDALASLRGRALVDHLLHLRFENHNLGGLEEALALVRAGAVDLLAFNDHTPAIARKARAGASGAYAVRSGISVEAFNALAFAAEARGAEAEAAVATLAAAAREAGVAMLSHDDDSAERRRAFDALGCRICEFPTTREAAAEARRLGNPVVMGSPNVLRGRSHIGWASATDMVAEGLCTILASDYFYPAMLQAPYRLDRLGVLKLAEAWRLVSQAPAEAAGLLDRGRLAPGLRADLVAVDDTDCTLPRIVAAWSAGRPVWGPAG